MVTIQREMLATVAMDVDELLKLHYLELCGHRERKVLAPRWQMYAAMELEGQLLVMAAREAGALVGYAAFFCSPHMHYEAYRVATNDVLFLHPNHRGGTAGARLIKQSENEAIADGCHHIVWRAKPNTPLFDILSRMKGYAPEETAFGRPLEG